VRTAQLAPLDTHALDATLDGVELRYGGACNMS
jgi:hypothetical protein